MVLLEVPSLPWPAVLSQGKTFKIIYPSICNSFWCFQWRQGDKKTRSPSELESFDRANDLSGHTNGFNATFYIGANKNGWRFILGQERRPQGIIHSVLYFLIPNRGIFKLPQLPDAMVFSTSEGESSNGFVGGGLSCQPREPMKKWKMSYKGDLLHDGKVTKNCHFEGEFYSPIGYLDYDTDLSIKAIAKSVATEPWTREYFQCLQS